MIDTKPFETPCPKCGTLIPCIRYGSGWVASCSRHGIVVNQDRDPRETRSRVNKVIVLSNLSTDQDNWFHRVWAACPRATHPSSVSG